MKATIKKLLASKETASSTAPDGTMNKYVFNGKPNKHGVAEHQAMKANRKAGK
jgi:hypothetical protein